MIICSTATYISKSIELKINKITNSHKEPSKEELLKLFITIIFIVTAFNKVTSGHNCIDYISDRHIATVLVM
jgi:hypothetical protein